ncbi:MAG: cadherin-like domain-containing protein, partial [Mycobacterium sp.]|nr:cadherin-like domain-containing protein [Mycobacterium sp.]
DNIAAFGYDIPKGHASATSTAGTESIGVVGENGVVTLNTTTVDANNNARSAVYDSTSGKLYVAGGNGVYEASLSSLTSTPGTFTQIYATSSDQVGIFGGRLFITTSHGIFDAGAEPTTAVTPTQLTSVDAGGSVTINTGSYTTGSPLTFFFANLGSGHNYNSTGDDTLYIIDTKGGSGAVLKYSYNGSSWTYEGGRAGPDTTSGAQLLGLTGSVSGSTATLYLTEGNDGSGATSELYTLTDSGGSTGSITSTALSQITLGTSGAGTGSTSSPTSSIYENFRNVAFAPTASALALGGLTAANFTTGGSAVILTGGNGTFADTLSSSQLNTSTLSIAITANGDSAHDVLAVNNQGTAAGQIGVSGSNITYTYLSGSATTIGSFTGGSGGSSLVVTLNSSATATAVQALYNQITFSTTSSSTTSRTVQFTFTPSVGSPVSASESVNIAPVGTPFISPGSSITLGENYGSYSTLLTGIGDGNSPNDNNADTTISAAVTAGGVGLFSSSPAVTGFNHTTGTATLGFTLASNASGTATITVTVTNTVTSNTTTATFNLTVNAITVTSVAPSVATGNAVDVLTTNLSAAETGVTATNTVYTITTLPTDGSLYLNGTGALGLGDTFTQQDVVFGLIYYVSTGSTSATDTVGFSVSDSAGGSV